MSGDNTPMPSPPAVPPPPSESAEVAVKQEEPGGVVEAEKKEEEKAPQPAEFEESMELVAGHLYSTVNKGTCMNSKGE